MKIVLLALLGVVLAGLLFRDLLFPPERSKVEVTVQAGMSTETLDQVIKGVDVPKIVAAWQPPAALQPHIDNPMVLLLEPVDTHVEAQVHASEDPVQENPAEEPKRGTPVQLDEETPVFWVKGIVYSRQNRSTVILDEGILTEGDTIFDAEVVRIDEHAVTFEKSGKTYCIAVGQQNTH